MNVCIVLNYSSFKVLDTHITPTSSKEMGQVERACFIIFLQRRKSMEQLGYPGQNNSQSLNQYLCSLFRALMIILFITPFVSQNPLSNKYAQKPCQSGG